MAKVEDTNGGRKDDGGKIRWDLLPLPALEEIARVYTYGVQKYDDWNWYKGLSYSRMVAAFWRHFKARIWEGELIDVESQCFHLSCCGFYILAMLTFDLEDRTQQWDDFSKLKEIRNGH